jgi:hypothetical protein
MLSTAAPSPPALVGEVIAATTTGFTAQVIEVPRPDAVTPVPDPPPFGAFVRVGGGAPSGDPAPLPDDFDPFEAAPTFAAPVTDTDPASVVLYGVVCHAETGALEAGRPLTAFGLDEDELRREQPQIYELLASRFTAALVAHADGAGDQSPIRPYLPPRPPRPHARVWLCTDAETRRLTERLDYLRPLLTGAGSVAGVAFPADELVSALLRNAWRAHNGSEEFALRAGRELSALLAGDYDRLRALISRMVG